MGLMESFTFLNVSKRVNYNTMKPTNKNQRTEYSQELVDLASEVGNGNLIPKTLSNVVYNQFDTDRRGVNGSRTPANVYPLQESDDVGA